MMTEPPFKLFDQDDASHVWVMGETLANKYRMPTIGKNLMEYAAKMRRMAEAVEEWRAARKAVLADPTPDVRQSDAFRAALDRLAAAENTLFNPEGTAP